MLPTGVHVELADTSAPARALLGSIETVNARLLAGWRGATWRHCSPLSGQRIVGALPSAEWRIVGNAGGIGVQPGDLDVDPDIEVHNTLPLYAGDRVLGTRVRMSSAAGNVVAVRLVRAYAGAPGSDETLNAIPAAETLIEVGGIVVPAQSGSLRRPIDVLFDVRAALAAPVTVREWDLFRVVTIATGVAPGSQNGIVFHATSVLTDHLV